MHLRSGISCAVLLTLVACGGEAGNESAATAATSGGDMAAPARSVTILSPAEGEEVTGPSVTVRLSHNGFTLVAAGDTTPNSGHHHLFLDRDLSPEGQAVPIEPGFIVHLGTGTSEYTFENVAPGEHTLIAVVGDALHVPLQPWVVDTVRFTVR